MLNGVSIFWVNKINCANTVFIRCRIDLDAPRERPIRPDDPERVKVSQLSQETQTKLILFREPVWLRAVTPLRVNVARPAQMEDALYPKVVTVVTGSLE